MKTFSLAVLACLVFGLNEVAASAPTDEARWCELLRADSLAGWDHGDRGTAGWTIKAGVLSAKADAAPLLSGFSFGDFELRCAWQATSTSPLRLLLPEVPTGRGLEIVLAEGDRCGAVRDDSQTLAAGIRVGSLPSGKRHTAVIRRAGARLTILVDDRPAAEVAINPQRRFGLGLSASGGAVVTQVQVLEPAGTPIFNGRDLTGWWTPGKREAWQVVDGRLTLVPGGGNYLRSEKLFDNFTLSLQYKMKKGGNSGIGIRTPRQGWPSGDGMELQLWDRPLSDKITKHSALAVYGNLPPLGRNDRSEEWNTVVVKADGYMISAWVNGQLVQQANTFDHPELKHRQLQGWIGFQDHGAWIEVKDVEVLDAPPGRGLEAWYAAKPRRGGAAVIERLMNPVSLAAIDRIASGAVTRQIDAPGEHVLADLKGPGAIVWIARSNDQGRLAFYFDGQETPRIDCKPGDLRSVLPELCENNNPVTTCLTYRTSLRIVLHEAKQAAYRIEYVSFPTEMRVESFSLRGSTLPRGWSDAALYRFSAFSHGVQREHDAKTRIETPKTSIAPATTEPLARLDGAGVVHWVRLKADKRVLDNNDLWLEATVDGESKPAVAAPVRFWFAPLAGQGNFHNYLVTDRGGPALTLAMPYTRGITFAASNRGQKKIDNVGLQLCYEAASGAADAVAPMRLRGVFEPAGAGSALLSLAGAGRCVGLVCEQPDGTLPMIDGLTIDGRPAAGWGDDLGLVLGQPGEKFRTAQSGRNDRLWWRFWQAAPLEFQQSIALRTNTAAVGDRLGWFYVRPGAGE